MKLRIPKLAAAALIGCLTLGLATPAIAQDGDMPETEEHNLPDIKARCDAAIEQRLDHLARAQAKVDNVAALTPRHEAAIDDIIDGTQSGLTRLSAQIDAATDPSTLIGLCAQVAPDFRVYLVVLPQTHLTIGADRVQDAVDDGAGVIAQLDAAIARAEEAGADVTVAQGLRDDADAHLTAAGVANDGVAAAVLAVTPSSYNTGEGAAVLDKARGQLRTGHDELKGAHASAMAAARALRDALGALA